MTTPQTFGECFSALMRKHKISISEMTRRMSYKSNTTVARILRDQCNLESIQRFYEQFMLISGWRLDAEESKQLREAYEVSRVGREYFLAYEELWELVTVDKSPPKKLGVRCFGLPFAPVETLEQLMDEYQSARHVGIHLFNCCNAQLFQALCALMDGSPEKVEIRHYFQLSDNMACLLESLAAVVPALSYSQYDGYYTTLEHWHTQTGRQMMADTMLVTLETRAGQRLVQIMSGLNGDSYALFTSEEHSGLKEMFLCGLEAGQGAYRSAKMQVVGEDYPTSLVKQAERYRLMEQDRALYFVKPDLPTTLLPEEIMRSMLLEVELKRPAREIEAFSKLSRLQSERRHNLIGKRRITRGAMSMEGMAEFALTGFLSNHPHGIRPLTVPERIATLHSCLELMRRNVYFELSFFRPEVAMRRLMCISYGGMGMLVANNHRDQVSLAGRQEMAVGIPGLAQLFERFYEGVLEQKALLNQQDSRRYLQALIDNLRAGRLEREAIDRAFQAPSVDQA